MSEAEQMLEDCEIRESRMTDWEKEFIDSLRNQVDRGFMLSVKQLEILEKIWDKVTARG